MRNINPALGGKNTHIKAIKSHIVLLEADAYTEMARLFRIFSTRKIEGI
jgi:hypothetical protein